jgi:hypothetical protein
MSPTLRLLRIKRRKRERLSRDLGLIYFVYDNECAKMIIEDGGVSQVKKRSMQCLCS